MKCVYILEKSRGQHIYHIITFETPRLAADYFAFTLNVMTTKRRFLSKGDNSCRELGHFLTFWQTLIADYFYKSNSTFFIFYIFWVNFQAIIKDIQIYQKCPPFLDIAVCLLHVFRAILDLYINTDTRLC